MNESCNERLPQASLNALLQGRQAGNATRSIVATMSAVGPMTAGEIARSTGLARSTISTVLAELRQSGVVVEAGLDSPGFKGVGRPSTPFTLNPDAGTCVGIHLALDQIDILVADIAHNVISTEHGALKLDYLPEDAATLAGNLVVAAYEKHGLSLTGLLGVGVSVSGPVAPDGTVMHSSILPNWAGMNVRSVFEPVFNKPVYADNESNCAAVAEMTWGAAINQKNFVLFKIDLGVGGAIVQEGNLVTGRAGGAGEFGHMTVTANGELCRCGNRGCLELSASFRKPMAELSRILGRPLSMDDAITLGVEGNTAVRRMIGDTATAAGRGLAMIGTMLDPPLIILGGRMALAGDLLIEPLKRAYERSVLIKEKDVPADARTRIMVGHFTENDSLLGAVGLVLRGIGQVSA